MRNFMRLVPAFQALAWLEHVGDSFSNQHGRYPAKLKPLAMETDQTIWVVCETCYGHFEPAGPFSSQQAHQSLARQTGRQTAKAGRSNPASSFETFKTESACISGHRAARTYERGFLPAGKVSSNAQAARLKPTEESLRVMCVCVVCVCDVVSCRVVSCRVVSCRVVSCRVVSCRVVSCLALRFAHNVTAHSSYLRAHCDSPGEFGMLQGVSPKSAGPSLGAHSACACQAARSSVQESRPHSSELAVRFAKEKGIPCRTRIWSQWWMIRLKMV